MYAMEIFVSDSRMEEIHAQSGSQRGYRTYGLTKSACVMIEGVMENECAGVEDRSSKELTISISFHLYHTCEYYLERGATERPLPDFRLRGGIHKRALEMGVYMMEGRRTGPLVCHLLSSCDAFGDYNPYLQQNEIHVGQE